ncbi:MAG: hypothetical protein E6H87_08320 [Chloroflexi bacterium]|nr:MAG: hypothetical protein E6I14_04380 [Chloroflexota bacterium]TMG60627.1 MAG: hypothetical protein E6H87_08320 [Chloroflexota bacterium]
MRLRRRYRRARRDAPKGRRPRSEEATCPEPSLPTYAIPLRCPAPSGRTTCCARRPTARDRDPRTAARGTP